MSLDKRRSLVEPLSSTASIASAAPPASAAAVPTHVYLSDLCLALTTVSRSADAAVSLCTTSALSRSDGACALRSSTNTGVSTRRGGREASLETFCFVVELDPATGQPCWFYAPLEDYNRKKLRVDEGVVKTSLLERGLTNGSAVGVSPTGSKKPVSVYFRLPESTTFRQLALVGTSETNPSSRLTSATSMTTNSKSMLTSTRIFPEMLSPQTGVEAQETTSTLANASEMHHLAKERSSSSNATSLHSNSEVFMRAEHAMSDSPPPLAHVTANHNSSDLEHDDNSRREEEYSGFFDANVPQPACVVAAPRYPDSDCATELSTTPGHVDSLVPPLSITLHQSEEDERDGPAGGVDTPLGAHSDHRPPSSLTANSSTASVVGPRCPPKLSAAVKASGRSRQHRQKRQRLAQPASGSISSPHARDPAACTSPTQLSRPAGPAAKYPVGFASASGTGSCLGLTEQSTTHSLGGSSEDPTSSSRRTSASMPRTASDLGHTASPEMVFTVNRFTPAPPPSVRQRWGASGAALDSQRSKAAHDDMEAQPARGSVSDTRTKRLLQTPNRPSIRRSSEAVLSSTAKK